MRKLLLVAGAGALLAVGAPAGADAKPGKGQKAQSANVKVATIKPAKAKVRASTWVAGCPSGLIWRGNVCLPPGQAKKLIAVGNRVPLGWAYTPWGSVPVSIRNNYEFSPQYRYIYRDGVVYAVDPGTRLISHILSVLP